MDQELYSTQRANDVTHARWASGQPASGRRTDESRDISHRLTHVIYFVGYVGAAIYRGGQLTKLKLNGVN